MVLLHQVSLGLGPFLGGVITDVSVDVIHIISIPPGTWDPVIMLVLSIQHGSLNNWVAVMQHVLVIRLAISGLCLIVVVSTGKCMDIMPKAFSTAQTSAGCCSISGYYNCPIGVNVQPVKIHGLHQQQPS